MIRLNGQQFGQDRPRRIVSGSISVRRLPRPRPMKIVQLEVIPLCGGTVDGGWPEAHKLEDDLHALIEITTDSGLTGIGSCFTSGRLVNGAIGLLWPMLRGESAVEPERVTEKLRQSTFWQG